MGLTNEPRTGGNSFVNFKDGKLVFVDEVGTRLEFTAISGLVTDLEITDEEYNQKKYRKVTVFITDEGKTYKLGFPLESGYGNCFCRIIPNVNFMLPVEISGGSEKMDNGNKYGKMFIRQGGVNLKWFYSKSANPGVPEPEEETFRGQVFKNFQKQNDFFFDLLFNKVRPRIKKAVSGAAAGAAASTKADSKKVKGKVTDTSEGEGFQPVDDLPF